MIKILLPLLISVAPLCWAGETPIKHNLSSENINRTVLKAIQDFSVIDAGDVPYYKEQRSDALSINAVHPEYRNLFAQADHEFTGKTGLYDITLTTLTEEDGESVYRLLTNNKVVGIYRNSYIGKGSPKDFQPETHTWTDIALTQGDTLSIESIAHTNGEIPEHGGTAWARGRWQQLELTPAKAIHLPRYHFRSHVDLLVAQFDSKPDADDIHAIAALGSMLDHADMEGVNYIAVAGAIGNQNGPYIDAPNLFTLAFGKEGKDWISAQKNWHKAVNFTKNRVKAVLAQGGKIWVQEAGQSDFTRDWVHALITAGVSESVIKNNVIVVQHSDWNEKKTTPADLAYVKLKTRYQAVNDGNEAMKEFNRKGRRGALTPLYVNEDKKWLASAISPKNTRDESRAMWQEAVSIIDKTDFNFKHSVIPQGGVDFSDIVENWWIFDLGHRAPSVHAFWERYVTNAPLDKISPPKGRLAIVIDGNSPDPDDIGATPVMMGLLQQTNLNDRLVHLSHSCDLDPFRNKGIQRINAKNELRRQQKLHELSGESIKLFGPFENLRDYYNCRVDQQGAAEDLRDAINNSTANDPLWIIEAGEPDLIGYALEMANPDVIKHVHVISHHPANDNSGDYFTWQQILDFGITQHQIGDQNVGLQTPMYPWDWAKNHNDKRIHYIWSMMAYAEQDGVVNFQTNKFDCSDAGMVYWWITGADKGGNNSASAADMKDMLLFKK
ncbi:hypothetical protein [Algibacillus agarilyticus]|uniref:hypothetical protein n=1 Tax=Algibacillus agarilyticus TaxID=2234133 RepID=UPI0018E51802|nr:hypothetical protein [Algibacillus agarilyticus]